MLRQPMHAAMDIGVGLFVEIAFGLYDRQRLLRRGAVIQISQPAPFDRTRQNGEIGNAIQRCRGTGHAYRCIHPRRSEEHTSELQSLMRISYAVFCLKKKKTK